MVRAYGANNDSSRKLAIRISEKKWIKCSDRLPEKDTECLVCCFTCAPDFDYEIATYFGEDKGFVSCNNLKINVTHWMERPRRSYELD